MYFINLLVTKKIVCSEKVSGKVSRKILNFLTEHLISSLFPPSIVQGFYFFPNWFFQATFCHLLIVLPLYFPLKQYHTWYELDCTLTKHLLWCWIYWSPIRWNLPLTGKKLMCIGWHSTEMDMFEFQKMWNFLQNGIISWKK